MNKNDVIKVVLPDEAMPRQWYNILADLPEPLAPYYSPRTMSPVTPEELSAIFPKEIIRQEMCTERFVDIPEEVLHIYRHWRPSPLFRARTLEKKLKTPARIYFKYEGTNASGSHKLNTALPQVFYNKAEGIKRIATETGAGQWGSALSMSCNHFGLECTIYMVKVSFEQKPYRKIFMNTFGGNVIPSPSLQTEAGRKILASDPNCSGSLGIAISEAVEDAATHSDTNYALGSVLNHVCMHQTIIGLEAKKQLEMVDEYPDIVIGASGGGSNLAGLSFPFMKDKFSGTNIRIIAVEPAACPSLTHGVYAYDYGDTAQSGPIAKMYTVGHNFVPSNIHAGGLRYHGVSPIISQLHHKKLLEARAYEQREVFDAAVLFTRTEGTIPAPESAHAIKAAIDEAIICRERGEEKVILFNLSGHGYFDLSSYECYFNGNLSDIPFSLEQMNERLTILPKV